jgi:hypothetical protein
MEQLPEDVIAKYRNTVEFMNAQYAADKIKANALS